MKKLLLVCSLCCLMILCTACAPAASPPPVEDTEAALPEEALEEGAEAPPLETPAAALPAFSALDIYGESVDSGIFTDYDLTMVNVWGTFCGPCIMEMPGLGELAAAMPVGTQLIGLVGDALNEETVELAQTIAESSGAAFTHIVPDKALYDYMRYNIVAVPTTLFVDSAGKLVGEPIIGAQIRAQYEAELTKRLEMLLQ